MIRIRHDNDGCPVVIYAPVATFPSVKAAAAYVKAPKSSAHVSVQQGIPCRGFFLRYADMPLACQPLKVGRPGIPVMWEGVEYTSILAAAGGNRALAMRIRRSMRRLVSK